MWSKDKTDPAENDPYDRPEGDRRPTTPGEDIPPLENEDQDNEIRN